MNLNQKMNNFDELYRIVSKNFADDSSGLSEFADLESDSARVTYVQSRLESLVTPTLSLSNKKEDELAIDQLKSAINIKYPERALQLVSSAVCLAPENTNESRQAYLARATLLSKLGFYEEASKDCKRISSQKHLDQEIICKIAMITTTCYAGEHKWKEAESTLTDALTQLRNANVPNSEKAALAMQLAAQLKSTRMHKDQKESQIPQPRHISLIPACPPLMSPKHPSIPNVCDAIELINSDNKGRSFVATRDIDVGSVLIVDKPYAWMLTPSCWRDHCSFCCRPVLAFLPCKSCSQVCFCDERCRDAAWNEFHRWECGALETLASSHEMSTMAPLVLRIITKAGLKKIQNPPKNPSDYLNPYSGAFWQETNASKRPVGDMIKRTITAIYLSYYLEKTKFCTKEQLKVVASALLRHLQSCSCNAYEITENVMTSHRDSGDAVAIGGAVYSSISLANHGCHSNVARHSHGNACVVRTTRKIKQGEEVLDNYGYNFLTCTKNDRQSGLNRQYFFLCQCKACEDDWPLFSSIPAGNTKFKCIQCQKTLGQKPTCQNCKQKSDIKFLDKKIKSFSSDYKNAIQKLFNNQIDESLFILLNYIKEMEDRIVHPNREFLMCQQAVIRCWSLLGNMNEQIIIDENEND